MLDDVVAIGPNAQLENQPIADAPAILREESELRAVDFRMRQRRRIRGPLGQRPIEAHGIDLLAEGVAIESRMLEVEADLEHVLAQPVIFRERQRLDELQASDVALLAIEEVAGLALRRVNHWKLALALLIDFERTRRDSRFEDGV